MILSKIKKHIFLFVVRLKQKKTISNILDQNHPLLTIIVDSFLQLKQSKLSNTDIAIFEACEKYRSTLLKDNTIISFSVFDSDKTMLVKDICKKAASKPIWAQFIFLITKRLSQPHFLEIGTNLGVSGNYVLEAIKNKKKAKFYTMEGHPQLCEIAKNQFSTVSDSTKYKIYNGLYKNTFPQLLNENNNFNVVFIDGNHKKEPTLQYFNDLRSKLSYPAILILDDINWSRDMQKVWKMVKSHRDVSYSIDMFKFGILILDKNITNNTSDYKLHLAY